MTAREHYTQAELLIHRGKHAADGGASFFSEALIHATLAVAGATIDLAEATQVISEQGPAVR